MGTIDANGFYTAPAIITTDTVCASSGTVVSNAATVNTVNSAPTVVNAAAADPSPVTGTFADLTVLGADDLGEANLTYTWSADLAASDGSACAGILPQRQERREELPSSHFARPEITSCLPQSPIPAD